MGASAWEFTEKGKPLHLSIQKGGDYRETTRGKMFDRGRVAMRGHKLCFMSAMNQGTACWTTVNVRVGGSGVTVGDKGQRLRIKRVA